MHTLTQNQVQIVAFVMYTYSPEQVRCVEVQADIDDEIEVYLRTGHIHVIK